MSNGAKEPTMQPAN